MLLLVTSHVVPMLHLHFIFTTSQITTRAVRGSLLFSDVENKPRQIDAILPQSSSLRCRDCMKITRDDVFFPLLEML